MYIDPSIDVIKQHSWGVEVYNHYGDLPPIQCVVYTDLDFCFTLVAMAVGEVLGITHLIDWEQTTELEEEA
ncbi:MAG: hypothetical protein GY928_17080 [Colwellia sp.]|nr:hypothetical protein [Colwellia sp.]